MNAVEIEAAVSDLAAEPFDAGEFPFQFLAAFDKKETTLKRLRRGDSNKSDVPGGVLLQANIHLAVCAAGETRSMLQRLKASPKTVAGKAKFILATDGVILEAEELFSGMNETIAPDYPRFAEHIGFFLPLAGISTVREIKDNPIDVRATGRLNKLYIELLKQNPEWGTEARRHDMNHFMARLIFCFFAEDTDIFHSRSLFTGTVEQFSQSDGADTHVVIEACFQAMNVKQLERNPGNTPGYAVTFPYVNGGLFSGPAAVPHFTRIARSYLLQAGSLDWKAINPDIFGSMIQAVADDAERGALGMHYTSVPNILKVLNPLFLDDLRAQLAAAGDNGRMLLNLRRRMSRIRVFDPACGSGNFLVIAYKQMRIIEAEINVRRGEHLRPSDISEKNFRGIEIRDFAAEIARLSLVISRFQCDVIHRGPLIARAKFLPLRDDNWITRGNALRLDWLQVCPPEGMSVKLHSDDLLQTPLEQPEIDFENEGGETFICGNPPYLGFTWQSSDQKMDLRDIFADRVKLWKSLDYVTGWFMKAADYGRNARSSAAFVSTNTICQGEHVPNLWPTIFGTGQQISFAHTSLRWSNLASHKAGVTVLILGMSDHPPTLRKLLSVAEGGAQIEKQVSHINAYLVPGADMIVQPSARPTNNVSRMEWGNKPTDGGYLFLNVEERRKLISESPKATKFIRRFLGAQEFIRGQERYCLWIEDSERIEAEVIPEIRRRLEGVATVRAESKAAETRPAAKFPHRFRQIQSVAIKHSLVVARVSSEERNYLPVGLETNRTIVGDRNFALYDAPIGTWL